MEDARDAVSANPHRVHAVRARVAGLRRRPAAQPTPSPAGEATAKPAAPAVDDPVRPRPTTSRRSSSSRRAVYIEARAEVEQALAAGAGRDARLLAAKLAILRSDLDTAADLLTPLAADGADALVHYNIGLVAQQRNQYNKARSAYLAALKAEPTYAPARFNLAVLAWDAGVHEEAQHHARKFLELSPDDPRAAELRTRVELDASGAPLPAAPATPGTAADDPPPDPVTGLRDPFGKRDPTKKQDSGLKDPFKDGKAKPGTHDMRPLDPFATPTKPANPGKAEALAPKNPFETK
jgi:tetratricopeptide (TPR) repeat protein